MPAYQGFTIYGSPILTKFSKLNIQSCKMLSYYISMGNLFICVQPCKYIVERNAHIWSNSAIYICS